MKVKGGGLNVIYDFMKLKKLCLQDNKLCLILDMKDVRLTLSVWKLKISVKNCGKIKFSKVLNSFH